MSLLGIHGHDCGIDGHQCGIHGSIRDLILCRAIAGRSETKLKSVIQRLSSNENIPEIILADVNDEGKSTPLNETLTPVVHWLLLFLVNGSRFSESND